MHADGDAGQEALHRDYGIKKVAIMAYIQSKLVDVHRSPGLVIAEEAFLRINYLHAVEIEARCHSAGQSQTDI